MQMGIAHLKKALTSEPLNGKEFSDMEDDDMEVRTATEAPAGYAQSSCSSRPTCLRLAISSLGAQGICDL